MFQTLLPPVVLVAGLTLSIRAYLGADWQVFRPGLLVEGVLLSYFHLLLRVHQRGRTVAALVFLSGAGLLYTATFLKYALFQEPLRIHDLSLVDELIAVTPWADLVAAGLVCALLSLLVAYNFRWPGWRGLCLALPVLVYAIGVAALPDAVRDGFDALRPPPVWRPDTAAFRNGPLFVLLRDMANDVGFRRALAGEANLPLSELRNRILPPGVVVRERSSVHVVVLESFVDPLRVRDHGLPSDPIDPRMRTWMSESSAVALAPAFATGSARSEFELLCGLPSYGMLGLEHLRLRGAPLPCWPNVLRDHGYRSIAINAVAPDFYNVRKAYRSFGFDEMVFEADFHAEASDLDGIWVSSEKVFEISLERVAAAVRRGVPVLSHVVTGSGHMPFELDPTSRPPVFDDDSLLGRVANAAFYNSRATSDFVAALEELDPDALIAIVADHLPPVAFDYLPSRAGREARKILPAQTDDRDALELRRVVLVVRHRGRSLPVGVLPHFGVLDAAFDRLTGGELCRNRVCQGHGLVARPLRERTVFTSARSFPELECVAGGDESGACGVARDADAWMRRAYLTILAEGGS